jgi:acetylxylan esterase
MLSCRTLPSVLFFSFAVLEAGALSAASLEQVSDWGAEGVPSTVSMYIYVPDTLAATPPIMVLVHYCGGTAQAVFGQAQGGGLIEAAEQHGFIVVVPQAANADGSGRCWDVGSMASLTRYGGGDTEAIIQMVAYTVSAYDANPERITVTGDSSGKMTTEALLALYPDIFKAGSAFAGVPAGCWAVDNPTGGWSGPCAGGDVSHTPAE